jgi:hypothetical protein
MIPLSPSFVTLSAFRPFWQSLASIKVRSDLCLGCGSKWPLLYLYLISFYQFFIFLLKKAEYHTLAEAININNAALTSTNVYTVFLTTILRWGTQIQNICFCTLRLSLSKGGWRPGRAPENSSNGHGYTLFSHCARLDCKICHDLWAAYLALLQSSHAHVVLISGSFYAFSENCDIWPNTRAHRRLHAVRGRILNILQRSFIISYHYCISLGGASRRLLREFNSPRIDS